MCVLATVPLQNKRGNFRFSLQLSAEEPKFGFWLFSTNVSRFLRFLKIHKQMYFRKDVPDQEHPSIIRVPYSILQDAWFYPTYPSQESFGEKHDFSF